MKKLLPFLIAIAMLPAVAFGASDNANGADAAVTDVPGEEAGTVEGPPESVEDEKDGQTHGQSSISGSDGSDISTESEALSEEEVGTKEGEARETPFDEDKGATDQSGMSGSNNTDGVTGMEPGDDSGPGGTMEGQPESVDEEEIN